MQRTIARLLVSVFVLSALGPWALAVGQPPAHCVRKPVTRDEGMSGMHCHELAGSHAMAGMSAPAAPATHSLRSNACCANHDCCRSSVRLQWAHVGPGRHARTRTPVYARVSASAPLSAFAAPSHSHSGRAPPLL